MLICAFECVLNAYVAHWLHMVFQWWEILFSSHKVIYWINLVISVQWLHLCFPQEETLLFLCWTSTETVTYIPAVILLNLWIAFNFGLTLAFLSFLSCLCKCAWKKDWRCLSSYIFLNQHYILAVWFDITFGPQSQWINSVLLLTFFFILSPTK